MIDIRPLFPRDWETSESLIAYNQADRRVVVAAEMSRKAGSYYDRYGYQGSQENRVHRLQGRRPRCSGHSRRGREEVYPLPPQAGGGAGWLGRHGETAEHFHGKQLIIDWARDQTHVLPWSVEEEFWVPGARLRSDVKAELASGRQLAFEVQRKPLDRKDWDRHHGDYENGGVRDVWLWSPDVPDLIVDLPLTSVVMDMAHESVGVLVASYAAGYRHPRAEGHILSPTHYAAAPLTEWGLRALSRHRPRCPNTSETNPSRPGSHSSKLIGKQRLGRQSQRGSRQVPRSTTTRAAPAGGAPANASNNGRGRPSQASAGIVKRA